MSTTSQFQGYTTEKFFDEMFTGCMELEARAHYEKIFNRFDHLTEAKFRTGDSRQIHPFLSMESHLLSMEMRVELREFFLLILFPG